MKVIPVIPERIEEFHSLKPSSLFTSMGWVQCFGPSLQRFFLLDENEKLPAEILVNGFVPEKGAKITMPGKKGGTFKWKTDGSGFKLFVSESQAKSLPSKYAVVFKLHVL